MTCDHALELLLEADLGELDGAGESPLARHVRDCAKCRAVAAQLAMDTRALAVARGEHPAARPTGARRAFRLYPVAFAGALAAALALVVLEVDHTAVDSPATSHPSSSLVVANPAARVAPPAPPPASRRIEAPLASRRIEAPAAARRFAEAVAATPVRLVASQSVAVRVSGDPDAVTVRAPEGTRVAVLKTGNAAITVVWLY
jgi:hypothetical protein